MPDWQQDGSAGARSGRTWTETAHQPPQQRERVLRQLTSCGSAQRSLSVFSMIPVLAAWLIRVGQPRPWPPASRDGASSRCPRRCDGATDAPHGQHRGQGRQGQ